MKKEKENNSDCTEERSREDIRKVQLKNTAFPEKLKNNSEILM